MTKTRPRYRRRFMALYQMLTSKRATLSRDLPSSKWLRCDMGLDDPETPLQPSSFAPEAFAFRHRC
ncbi:hypothetical protein [Thioclava sp. JE_KL1]|uniref:hypothetical protein n=1 Tax=Thioclava sp. JE_KL1 TaxID=2651187 RepID=UPI00128D3737|nr:hypothetical protein [Thioclava sp. JE_KL1]MPQ96098.1 hypothetical protein [Thioclava sp. JE_KL1]